MNDLLLKEYMREEIKHALDDIGDLKAPGADGMHTFVATVCRFRCVPCHHKCYQRHESQKA